MCASQCQAWKNLNELFLNLKQQKKDKILPSNFGLDSIANILDNWN